MKTKAKKAQASSELLTVYSILLVIFIFSFAVVSGQVSTIAQMKGTMDAYEVAAALGPAINAIYLAGDGANASLDLGRRNANISIDGYSLEVRVENTLYDWPLLTPSASADNVSTGTVLITNSNGVIHVDNA